MSIALSFRPMAAAAMLPALNTMLGGRDRSAYERARSALADADSVQEALEAVGVLDDLDDDAAVEARALLDALRYRWTSRSSPRSRARSSATSRP